MFGPDDFDEERVREIIREVRDHLSDDPPNMAGVMDLAEQLEISDENKEHMMDDLKEYMNRMIADILDSMGFPEWERDQAVASMAYALGTLNDREYMNAMGGAFGGNNL
jgi:arginyl-tRNA synthetase